MPSTLQVPRDAKHWLISSCRLFLGDILTGMESYLWLLFSLHRSRHRLCAAVCRKHNFQKKVCFEESKNSNLRHVSLDVTRWISLCVCLVVVLVCVCSQYSRLSCLYDWPRLVVRAGSCRVPGNRWSVPAASWRHASGRKLFTCRRHNPFVMVCTLSPWVCKSMRNRTVPVGLYDPFSFSIFQLPFRPQHDPPPHV